MHLLCLSSLAGHVKSQSLRPQHPWEAQLTARIRETEIWIIGYNSCVLIICVSSYCTSEMDPMTKIHFYKPDDYPMLQGEMQPDLSNYLFFVQILFISLKKKSMGQRGCGGPCHEKF